MKCRIGFKVSFDSKDNGRKNKEEDTMEYIIPSMEIKVKHINEIHSKFTTFEICFNFNFNSEFGCV